MRDLFRSPVATVGSLGRFAPRLADRIHQRDRIRRKGAHVKGFRRESHRESHRELGRGFALAICIASVIGFCGAGVAQEAKATSSPEELAANNLAQIAFRAQNDSDYPFAAQQWEKLLTEHPQSTLVGKAAYNAGVCYVQMQKYDLAAAKMSTAIPKLAGDDAWQQPEAYLWLGFSQLRAGQAMSRRSDAVSEKEANILLTTSTKSFADLLKNFPEFVDADQAAFFQGNAFEDLTRLEDAAQSYKKMLSFEKQTFKFDGLFALANVYEQLSDYPNALDYYKKFQTAAAENGGHPLLDDVNYRMGKTWVAQGVSEVERGAADSAATSFQTAEKLFGELAGQNKEGKADEFLVLADDAQFQQAYCLTQLGQFEKAAQVYEAVAARPKSAFVTRALVYAGRSYVQAGKEAQATKMFQKAVDSDSPFAIEGAASLSSLYLKNEDYQSAYDMTNQWIARSSGSPQLPQLMADRADAAYELQDKRADSPALFLEIADKFSQHQGAPSALYNASYALLELGELDEAIAVAARFEKDYPTSDFLPDTLEVKADALLLKEDAGDAEKVFDRLIASYPQNEKVSRWRLRSAVAKFVLAKYQPVIDTLKPHLGAFEDPKRSAEAQHWVGASYFNLEQFAPAADHLQKAIQTERPWRSADQSRLMLARAQFKTEKPEAAEKNIEQMITEFPDSPLLGKAHYYLGENAYEKGEYQPAYDRFQKVIDETNDSELTPLAIYNAAWCQLELERFQESDALFTKLMEEYPDHELAKKSKTGRGSVRRKTGKTNEAIVDLTTFLATAPEGTAKFNALYELGLAQVDAKGWPDAVKTFETLLVEDAESPRTDRYHYELAWALESMDQPTAALKQFAAIVENTPESSLAAESHFHLGSAAYLKDDFSTAIAAYEKCVAAENASANVREKAIYKLGWAYYKQEQFEPAFSQFTQQVSQFPDGELAADGKFMIAESQFRQKNHAAALDAYRVARPAVEASENVAPTIRLLTLLHGAQSANQVKQFEEALELATPLTDSDIDDSFQTDAWLEIGTANEGLSRPEKALEAWSKAKVSNSTTGARAACMVGDQYFKQKEFDKAIEEFKMVHYRFGSENNPDEIKPWVAYSLYEAARCSFVQVGDAAEDQKPVLIAAAIKQFETLVENYPADRLAPEAKKQLEKLKRL